MPAKRIMVVDDDPLLNEALSRVLREAGYEVATLTDSKRAVDLAVRLEPDLVILDVAMPDVDGNAVALELQKRPETAKIPIVFLSAVAGTTERLKTYESGGALFISKPFDQQTVLTVVSTVLRRRTA